MLVFEVMYCKLEHILIHFSQKELVYRTERVLGIWTEWKETQVCNKDKIIKGFLFPLILVMIKTVD